MDKDSDVLSIECSAVIVDGIIVSFRDTVTVDVTSAVGCTVPVTAGEVYVSSSVSLTGLLIISEGLITEGYSTESRLP